MFNGYLRFDVHKCTKANRMLRFDSRFSWDSKSACSSKQIYSFVRQLLYVNASNAQTYILAQEYKIKSSSEKVFSSGGHLSLASSGRYSERLRIRWHLISHEEKLRASSHSQNCCWHSISSSKDSRPIRAFVVSDFMLSLGNYILSFTLCNL